ncbi:hypothetical protein E2562_020963 [Oryza meyeriana var. granulata]|uniref:Uncharacterized protein n=1 Tax=Oryza meyeriana var. granulata TaxID=110450 RepID=A0A6G1DZC8_9ORYZ|nr:hypothetical protein E2562_020963 [Oryza meyeriana var. granulata]
MQRRQLYRLSVVDGGSDAALSSGDEAEGGGWRRGNHCIGYGRRLGLAVEGGHLILGAQAGSLLIGVDLRTFAKEAGIGAAAASSEELGTTASLDDVEPESARSRHTR